VYWGEIGISLGMALLALAFYSLATFTQNINPVDPGPAFYPKLVSLLLLGFSLAQLVRTWGDGRRAAGARAASQTDRRAARYSLGTLALSVVFVALFTRVPYLVSTTGFLLALMLLTGVRRWLVLGGAALGYALVTYYLFGQFLMVPLP
jgi:hypothetical protein